jgi:hypothetical protein
MKQRTESTTGSLAAIGVDIGKEVCRVASALGVAPLGATVMASVRRRFPRATIKFKRPAAGALPGYFLVVAVGAALALELPSMLLSP